MGKGNPRGTDKSPGQTEGTGKNATAGKAVDVKKGKNQVVDMKQDEPAVQKVVERDLSVVKEDTVTVDEAEMESGKDNTAAPLDTEPVSSTENHVDTVEETESPKTIETPTAASTIQMLSHKDEKVRIEAIESLLKIADKTMVYAFASAMKDTSFRVRLGALRGLYKYGGDLAVEYLLKALEDKHPDVRRRALIYLGWMRKTELVPYITSLLSDGSARVRKVAAYALGDIKDESAVPYLIKALDDVDEDVVKGAIAALKRITGESFASEQKSVKSAGREIISQWKEWWKKVTTPS